jgi:hypothetical protein
MTFRSTILASSLAIAALAFAAQASAACSYPKAPDKVPDGAKATKEDMLAGMKAVKAYDALVQQYNDCLQSEHDAAVAKIDPALPKDKHDAQKAELDKIQQQRNDAAVADDQALAARFNEQIRAFNAAHKN